MFCTKFGSNICYSHWLTILKYCVSYWRIQTSNGPKGSVVNNDSALKTTIKNWRIRVIAKAKVKDQTVEELFKDWSSNHALIWYIYNQKFEYTVLWLFPQQLITTNIRVTRECRSNLAVSYNTTYQTFDIALSLHTAPRQLCFEESIWQARSVSVRFHYQSTLALSNESGRDIHRTRLSVLVRPYCYLRQKRITRVCLSVCLLARLLKTRIRIWIKCCDRCRDMHKLTNFWADPDFERIIVRMPEPDYFLWYHIRCNAEFYYVGKISHIGIGRSIVSLLWSQTQIIQIRMIQNNKRSK